MLSVSCSETEARFAAGGGEGTLSRLALYKVDNTENVTIEIEATFIDPSNGTVFGTTFSPDGKYMYSVGKNKTITGYNLTTL